MSFTCLKEQTIHINILTFFWKIRMPLMFLPNFLVENWTLRAFSLFLTVLK